jgi:hypothetical protein
VSLAYGLGMNNNGTSLCRFACPRLISSHHGSHHFHNIVQHLVAGVIHQITGRDVGRRRYEARRPVASGIQSCVFQLCALTPSQNLPAHFQEEWTLF